MKILLTVFFITLGLFADTSNFTPYLERNNLHFGKGLVGVLLEDFIGSTTFDEVRVEHNGQRSEIYNLWGDSAVKKIYVLDFTNDTNWTLQEVSTSGFLLLESGEYLLTQNNQEIEL